MGTLGQVDDVGRSWKWSSKNLDRHSFPKPRIGCISECISTFFFLILFEFEFAIAITSHWSMKQVIDSQTLNLKMFNLLYVLVPI